MAITITDSIVNKRRVRASGAQIGTGTSIRMASIATLLAVLVAPLNAWSATSVQDNASHTDQQALLGWAIHLSRYATDRNLPLIRYESHRFFVEHACLGRVDCRVLGWYNDRDIVYIDETLSAMDSLFERSLLVHEFVHVLQHRSGSFDDHDCENFVEREREAYAVQQAFYVAHGAVPTIRARHFSCTASTIIANAATNPEDEGLDVASQSSQLRQAVAKPGDQIEASVANEM